MEPIDSFPAKFDVYEVAGIRVLTQGLGRVVQDSVLAMLSGVALPDTNRDRLRYATEIICDKLRASIGDKRLKPQQLHSCYQSVIPQISEELKILFNAASYIYSACSISEPNISFQRALDIVRDPKNLHGRYWIEAALAIAREACDPTVILEGDMVLIRGVPVGPQLVIFDGIVVQFQPGLNRQCFTDIQAESSTWETVEVKWISGWWRLSKEYLSTVPRDFVRQLDKRLDRAADWAIQNLEGEWFPPYADNIYCLRGLGPNILFRREWWQEQDEWFIYNEQGMVGVLGGLPEE